MSRRIQPNRAVLTMPVPVAGYLAGVGRNTAYNAVTSGDFPSIEVCGRRLVLTEPFCRMFGIAPDDPRIAIAFKMAGYNELPPQPAGGSTPAATPTKTVKAKAKTRTRRVARKAAHKGEAAPAVVTP